MQNSLTPMLVSILCIFITPRANAQLTPIEAIATIRFGAGTDRLGIDSKSGDAMRPLFFGIDTAGNIHIPDFENGRIAIFTRTGTFVREVRGVEGVTPRMNFFDIAPDGSYIAFSDGALSRTSASGEPLWCAPFPLGTIPSAILCGDEAVYFLLESGGAMECYAIPMTPPYSAFSSTMAGATGSIAAIKAGSLSYAWRLSDMPVVNPGFMTGALEPPTTPTLVGAFKNGLSVWQSEGSRGRQLYIMENTGRLIRTIRLGDIVEDESSWHTIRVAEWNESIITAILSITDEALIIKSIIVSK